MLLKGCVALSCMAALACWIVGCDSSASSSSDSRPRVVATTTMIGDVVKQVAGDRVQLKVIMPPGVDPHTFKPSTADLGDIEAARLVLFNGLHLEGKMVDLLENEMKGRAVAITTSLPQDRLLSWQQGEGGAHDPHVWFDVSLWQRTVAHVRDALIKVDPDGADAYRKNAESYEGQLAALHTEVKDKLAQVPRDRRVLITSHDAYNYFGRTYEIEVFGLQGISTETEAGLASVNRAVDFIIERKIPAIFVESSVSPKTIERVQADCKARGFDVKIGGELYSDAMGAPGDHPGYADETYPGMVRFNVDTIVKALK